MCVGGADVMCVWGGGGGWWNAAVLLLTDIPGGCQGHDLLPACQVWTGNQPLMKHPRQVSTGCHGDHHLAWVEA